MCSFHRIALASSKGHYGISSFCHYFQRSSHAKYARLCATDDSIRKVAIVGGGLAGLSTAFHLLEKTKDTGSIHVTIIDKAPVGTAGASSVAGGLVHPLSPRGKLVHWGREGLATTNRLVAIASQYAPEAILRQEFYRVALSENNVKQLRDTALSLPEYVTWLSRSEMSALCGSDSLGGLKLSNGCKVLHVPSYLQGLWAACQDLSHDTATWQIEEQGDDTSEHCWKQRLEEFDTVVLAAGAGLWQGSLLSPGSLPVELIRGQSIELQMPPSATPFRQEAVLCGKYVSPLLHEGRVLVGATHEFQSEPLSADQVVSDLYSRSQQLAPDVWENGTVHKITSGWRVQSQRGAFGRVPIVGKIDWHPDAWLFTGLSSRGLLYHGIYGDILTNAILEGNEENMISKYGHLDWWRKTKSSIPS